MLLCGSVLSLLYRYNCHSRRLCLGFFLSLWWCIYWKLTWKNHTSCWLGCLAARNWYKSHFTHVEVNCLWKVASETATATPPAVRGRKMEFQVKHINKVSFLASPLAPPPGELRPNDLRTRKAIKFHSVISWRKCPMWKGCVFATLHGWQ